MNQETRNKLADDMADRIVAWVRDPRAWPMEARLVAESIGLRVTRLKLYAPTLADVCTDIVRTAVEGWGKTERDVREAIDEIATRDRS